MAASSFVRHALVMAGSTDERTVAAVAAACAGRQVGVDPDEVASLVRLALELGATPEQVASAPDVGVLVLDRRLRAVRETTIGEVVAECGATWPEAEPYLRAAGLPVDPDDQMTHDEAEAVRLVVGHAREVLGDEATLQLARVTGNATARLGESLVDLFRLRVEVPRRDAGIGPSEMVEEYSRLALALMPVFSRTLDALLRRRVLSVAATMWSTDEERSAVTVQRTVGFVDLVGYTEATASMSVRELSRVLMDFDHATSDAVSRHHGFVVKSIGDEVMFSTEDASDACRIAAELLDASGRLMPEVRIGMAAGEMVTVFGDLFGPDVNLAARLVGASDPSCALVAETVRRDAPEFEFEALPPLDLKGLSEPVAAYRLVRPAGGAG